MLNWFKKIFNFCWKKGGCYLVYHLFAFLQKQDMLILYSALPQDNYGNIDSLARYFDEHEVTFLRFTKQDMFRYPFRFFAKLARAKVLIVDATSPAAWVKLHRNTTLIQCWHAGGVYKKVGFDAKRIGYDVKAEEKRIARIHRSIAYFVCSSEYVAQIYSKAFNLKNDQMLTFGVPRIDGILKCKDIQAPSIYTILFAPTFRTINGNKRILPLLPPVEQLRKDLTLNINTEVRLAFRKHPTVEVDNVQDWEDWSDIPQQEALTKASVLVTDYSSIFFDFLPFNRPVIFFVPDIAQFQHQERALYFSPFTEFPKTTCDNVDTLVQALVDCYHNDFDYSEFWKKYMGACDGRSTERLCLFILNIMKEKVK